MSYGLNNNGTISAPKAWDDRTGKFSGGAWIPFVDTAEALAAVPSSRRYVGLTLLIGTPSAWTEYWFKSGIADINLVPMVFSPSAIATDTTHRFVTDAEKSTWNTGGGSSAPSPWQFNVDDYGGVGDRTRLADANVSASSTTLTSASASFTSDDATKSILLPMGAGGIDILTTIATYVDPHTVTLAVAATVTLVNAVVIYGTDNTQAYQDAVNDAVLVKKTGGDVITPNKGYLVAGPLVTSDNIGENPNSQIYIPALIPRYESGSDQPIVIRFVGVVEPNVVDAHTLDIYSSEYNIGSQIQSILPYSAVSGTRPAVIGCAGNPGGLYGPFNVVQVTYENMWVRTHHDAVHGAYLCGMIHQWNNATRFVRSKYDVDVSAANTLTPVAGTVGMMGVHSNGGTINQFFDCMSVGAETDFAVGEHGLVMNCYALAGKYGFAHEKGNHRTTVINCLTQGCIHPIAADIITGPVSNPNAFVTYIGFGFEHANTGKWYDSGTDIYDPGNILQGNVYFHGHGTAGGGVTTMTKTGGALFYANHIAAQDVNGDNLSPLAVAAIQGIPSLQVGGQVLPTGKTGVGLNNEAYVTIADGRFDATGSEKVGTLYIGTNQGASSNGIVGRIVFLQLNVVAAEDRGGEIDLITDGALNTTRMAFSVMNAGTLATRMVIKKDHIFIANGSAPAAPTGGGALYVENGALKYLGSSGNTTVIAPA